MFDKSVKLDIPCPECGYETSLSIAKIESNPSYTCGGCKKTINLNAADFKDGLKDAEKQLKAFEKDLKKMFK